VLICEFTGLDQSFFRIKYNFHNLFLTSTPDTKVLAVRDPADAVMIQYSRLVNQGYAHKPRRHASSGRATEGSDPCDLYFYIRTASFNFVSDSFLQHPQYISRILAITKLRGLFAYVSSLR
jgi:hypothetical protein